MARALFLGVSLALLFTLGAQAVETGGSYVTTPPTVTGWSSGWPMAGVTGWDYVGQVNGASGVYLGNDWVLTAGHVGPGDFTLGASTYSYVAGSSEGFSDVNGTADLSLFKIATAPALNFLTLSLAPPTPFSQTQAGSQAVIIGFGGGAVETWGANTVDYINEPVQPTGYNYVSNDFLTIYGTSTAGSSTSTNNAMLVGGDSGGGAFIYNTASQTWELAGLNEVAGSGTVNGQNVTLSGFVQLNTYATQINAVTGNLQIVPEPASWLLLVLGLAVMAVYASANGKSRMTKTTLLKQS